MEGMPAEQTGLPSVGAEIAGKYRIESVLGQGGMGAVFAARNKLTGKRVAIKWLLPEHAGSSTRERLLREAQIASSIEHPNVVDIYDVGEHEGGLFLVMEYLRGKPLSEVLAASGRLDPEPLIALLVPAMRGVHAAHLAGVIHRDLKPDNILLSEQDGRIVPKVVDFGVSKTLGASQVPASSLTRTGALVGTPHYMALEQVDGSNAIDARTDVYAFGVLLYFGLTGHYPFDGTTLGEVILKIGTKEPAPMRSLRPELPAALDAVVLRALSRDRARRFADLEELARALSPFSIMRTGEPLDPSLLPRSALSGSTAQSQSGQVIAARPTPPLDGRLRRRGALLAGTVTGLALGVAGVWFAMQDRPAAAPIQVQPAAMIPAPVLQEAAPSAALAVEPQQADPAEASAPEAPAEEEQAQAPLHEASEAAAAESEPSAAPSEPPAPSRSRRERTGRNKTSPARPTGAVGVIRGERTNGFSVDEF